MWDVGGGGDEWKSRLRKSIQVFSCFSIDYLARSRVTY
jgi:hypothetical protein